MPVPAPAVIQLMRGFPTFPCHNIRGTQPLGFFTAVDLGVAGEMITPTGAALLKGMVKQANFGLPPDGFTPLVVGSGAGTKASSAANGAVIQCLDRFAGDG